MPRMMVTNQSYRGGCSENVYTSPSPPLFFKTLVCRVLKARRDYAIRSVPNVLEFFGYVYCFSSILAGPAFEYKEYHNATSGKGYEKVTGTKNNTNYLRSIS